MQGRGGDDWGGGGGRLRALREGEGARHGVDGESLGSSPPLCFSTCSVSTSFWSL
jgi:hypothetical protein